MAKTGVREKLVDAGVRQFHRAGFNGSSVEDITTLAGVPKGSFYNHFESKEGLAVQAIERYRALARHPSLTEPGRPPIKRLRNYFASLAKAFTEADFERGCLLGNLANEVADHSPAIREQLKVAFAEWARALTAVVSEAQAAGEVTSTQKPEQLASWLLSAWQGALVRAKVAKDAAPLRDFTDVAFGVLLK
jgi:TetR/AcrR family transcriptional repressor of nem operon